MPSTTTGRSSHRTPAFSISSRMAFTLVARFPLRMRAEIGTHPAVADERHGLAGLVDLPSQSQHGLRPSQLVGGEPARDHKSRAVGCAHVPNVRIDRHGIPALALIRPVAEPGDHGRRAFFL